MNKLLFFLGLLIGMTSCLDEKKQAELILRHYIDNKVDLIKNYKMETDLAVWNATVSGNEADYKKLIDIELDFNKANQKGTGQFNPDRMYPMTQNVFADQQDFELLKKLKFSGLITDTLLMRQLNVLYHAFMGSQIESQKYGEILAKEVEMMQKFWSPQINMDGKSYKLAQVDSMRRSTTDDAFIQKIAQSLGEFGRMMAPGVIQMVKNRNEVSVGLGYPNYYYLALEEKDQIPEQIKSMLDEIEEKTSTQFFKAKAEIDQLLAKRFGIPVEDLRPWHYNDEATTYLPPTLVSILDTLLMPVNPIQRTAAFFEGIGFPIQDVIDNSQLECTPSTAHLTTMVNVDFKNDIRLLAGIQNNHDGLMRMMHLGGHASHYKWISDEIPYLLKEPNSVVSEGVARYFECLAWDQKWLNYELLASDGQLMEEMSAYRHVKSVDRLIRCRKLLVTAAFEREIYMNPDQDLDLLWHRLNQKYLGLNFPQQKGTCYWASNRSVSNLSCTTHNFVLADIMCAQLKHAIETKALTPTKGSIQNNKDAGRYLNENLYQYGNLYPWDQLIKKATGEPLNTDYFVRQLLGDENN